MNIREKKLKIKVLEEDLDLKSDLLKRLLSVLKDFLLKEGKILNTFAEKKFL